jgi:hypothetical protein
MTCMYDDFNIPELFAPRYIGWEVPPGLSTRNDTHLLVHLQIGIA